MTWLRRMVARWRLGRALPQARGRVLDRMALDMVGLTRAKGWRERLPILGDRRFRRRIKTHVEMQARPGTRAWAKWLVAMLDGGTITEAEAREQCPLGISLDQVRAAAGEEPRG